MSTELNLNQRSTIRTLGKSSNFQAHIIMLNRYYPQQAFVNGNRSPDREIRRKFLKVADPIRQVSIHLSRGRYQEASNEETIEQSHRKLIHSAMARGDVTCFPLNSKFLSPYVCREINLSRVNPRWNQHFCLRCPATSPREELCKQLFDRFHSIAFASLFALFGIKCKLPGSRRPFHGFYRALNVISNAKPIFA